MTLKRRSFLGAGGAASALALGAWSLPASAQAGEVVVGCIQDLSGPLQVFGQPKHHILKFGIEELNATGGLLGRRLRLVAYDAQSNNQLYAQFAQQLALRDKAAVAFAATTSAAREVVRPVLARSRTPYFYNTPYEGGVCDRNAVVTGVTPSQSLQLMVPWLIKRYGKRVYVLGADYNFGQLSAKWIRRLAADNGGEVVGAELFPLDVANFSATLGKIQAAQPHVVINSFVGPAHASFYGQWAASGLKGKIALASQTFGSAGEHLSMPQEVTNGIYISNNYMQELDLPSNVAFLKRFRAAGYKDYVSEVVIDEYIGLQLWAAAVRKAGSFEREAVMKAIDGGVSAPTPVGTVTLDAATRHCRYDIYLMETKDGGFRVLETSKGVVPTDAGGQCDLVKNPTTNRQFEPSV